MNTIPHDVEVEKAILSICLQYPDSILPKLLSDGVTEEYFYDTRNKAMLKIMLQERAAGHSIELVSLGSKLMQENMLDQLGDPSYLAELYSYSPTTNHYSQHLEILKQLLSRRRLAAFISSVDAEALMQKSPDELASLTRDAAKNMLEVATDQKASKNAESVCDDFDSHLVELLDSKGKPGIQTRIAALDDLTGGLRKNELWIVCGQTSSGKSVLSLQLAGAALAQNMRVGIFSLEMCAHENAARLISNLNGIRYSSLTTPHNLTETELAHIEHAITELRKRSLMLCDEANLSIDRITALAQQWHDVAPLDMLVVDYIQLIHGSSNKEARHEQLSHISGQLKQLAKQLHCPVVVPSQLNIEGRMAKAKSISDDADVILRIQDEGIKLLKNRNGRRDISIPLQLNGAMQRFELMEAS